MRIRKYPHRAELPPAPVPEKEPGRGRPRPQKKVLPESDLRRGGVLYGVIPGLFGNKPFAGVTRELPRLQKLGVDALWLAPIQPTPDKSPISYAITDFFGIRDDYGSKEEFATLVREAHARGIRVLLDFVPNHTSNRHPYFLDALEHGKASPYYDYYARDAAGEPTHYFNWKHLPNLNYDNPKVRTMLLDALTFWVRDMGVDGFRMDALWGIARRNPDMLRDIERALRRVKPDVFLLAEAEALDPQYARAGFDAGYDWQSIGHWAWEELFDKPATAGERLRTIVRTSPARAMHFLDNNDTGKRFIDRYGEPLARVASVLTMTLPGVALVYNGEEVGAKYDPYKKPPQLDFTRQPITEHYERLIALRQSVPALRDGNFRELGVGGARSVYAFKRRAPDGSSVIVALNFGDAARDVPVTIGDHAHDLLTGTTIAGGRRLSLPPHSAFVLASEPAPTK